MTEPGLSKEELIAQTAQRQASAEQAMATLMARVANVKQAQQQALRATGEAMSRDGTVHAVVDATGVVTSLRFASTTFEATTPDRLAQTVVATIQSAAAQARGRMSASLAPVRENSAQANETITKGLAALGIPRLGAPEVPRTATDPTVDDPWSQQHNQQPTGPEWGAIAPDAPQPPPNRPHLPSHPPEPIRPPAPSHRPRQPHVTTSDAEDWSTDERPW